MPSGIYKHKLCSEETKNKMSLAHKGIITWNKGKHLSEKHKMKVSLGMKGKNKGKNNGMYGKHHSDKIKQQIGDALRGNKSPSWKGGRTIHSMGYILIQQLNHPRANKQGYIAEHRLVIEQKLGRLIESWEIVHHIDFNKSNNHPENLYLFPNQGEHMDYHAMLRCFVRQALDNQAQIENLDIKYEV